MACYRAGFHIGLHMPGDSSTTREAPGGPFRARSMGMPHKLHHKGALVLIGKLSFAARAVSAGHLFLRRCGAYFRGAWFHHSWQLHQLDQSIQWKELLAIFAAAFTWGHLWSTKRIGFLCDNEAVVRAWQSQRAKNPAFCPSSAVYS